MSKLTEKYLTNLRKLAEQRKNQRANKAKKNDFDSW